MGCLMCRRTGLCWLRTLSKRNDPGGNPKGSSCNGHCAKVRQVHIGGNYTTPIGRGQCLHRRYNAEILLTEKRHES
jgi:hypothetical protein